MPHFYFHVWREGQLTPDEAGIALLTLDAAQRRAESIAVVIRGQEGRTFRSLSGWDLEVTDQTGQTVLMTPISEGQQSLSARQAA